MSTRANWFTDGLEALSDDQDPFSQPIEEVGQRIDLRDPKSILELKVSELLHRESAAFNRGLTCAIKDRSDTTCHACPVSRAHDQTDRLSTLCRLGREQESALTELAVLQCQAG